MEKLAILNMGLEKRLDEMVALLSGGQRQALSLVMATLTPSEILLLNKHTAALNPESSNLIINITNKVIKEGNMTALMTPMT